MTSNGLTECSAASASSARQGWEHSDHVKRESRHIYNKLHSISHDSAFVHRIHRLFPRLLLTANLRCGAWYTDPTITSAVSYFKSTDGHTHQWGFSLKRSNLHLVPSIVDAGGAVVVDSTRRGKSMPDALSKTIPIWCAVLNRASQRQHGYPAEDVEGFALQTPQWMIPPSEHDQIQARIDGFVDALLDSDLQVPKLERPLKPIFVTPQMDLDTLPGCDGAEFTPMLLVSASRFVSNSADLGEQGKEHAGASQGFVYVQGAGDDHENWARGLTPDVFWKHRDQLLVCGKAELEALVDIIVATESEHGSGAHWFTPLFATGNTDDSQVLTTAPASGRDLEIGDTGLFIGSRPSNHTFSANEKERFDLIIYFTSISKPVHQDSLELAEQISALAVSDSPSKPELLTLHMSPNKKGLSAIRTVFPLAIEPAYRTLTSTDKAKVLICCQDGKDLSGSLAVAILASCFTDKRQPIPDDETRTQHQQAISKDTTKRRLQWLVSANPRAAPSRAFLLRVNELLISHRHKPIQANT